MWRNNQPHGCSRPILFPHSAKRVRDCRQNIPWLLWNALLTTPYVSERYKYMFVVPRDLYQIFGLYRGKHTTRRSTVGIWSEVRVYCTSATNIPWAGGLYLGKFPDNRRLMCPGRRKSCLIEWRCALYCREMLNIASIILFIFEKSHKISVSVFCLYYVWDHPS